MTDRPTPGVDSTAGEPARPALRLVRGDAQPEELAALLTVLSARASGAGGDRPRRKLRGRWGDPADAVRRAPSAGPGAWRSSGRQH